MTRESYIKRMEEIAEREKAATPGPWTYNSYSAIFSLNKERNSQPDVTDGGTYEVGDFIYNVATVEIVSGDTATPEGSRNADFIAASRTDLPALREALSIAVEALEEIGESVLPQFEPIRAREAMEQIFAKVSGA